MQTTCDEFAKAILQAFSMQIISKHIQTVDSTYMREWKGKKTEPGWKWCVFVRAHSYVVPIQPTQTHRKLIERNWRREKTHNFWCTDNKRNETKHQFDIPWQNSRPAFSTAIHFLYTHAHRFGYWAIHFNVQLILYTIFTALPFCHCL